MASLILLGASQYPNWPDLDNQRFKTTAERVKKYFFEPGGVPVTVEESLDLFDSDLHVVEQLSSIRKFVNTRATSQIIVYYIGHGGFTRSQHQYFLAARRLEEGFEAYTGFVSSHFADQLRDVSLNGQLFVILDCCYSAQAMKDFMGAREVNTMLEGQTYAEDLLQRKGAALLTASSKYQPAIAPSKSDVTMFSGALLDVLKNGVPGKDQLLSFDDVASEIRKVIRAKYPGESSMPEVFAPVQNDSDLTRKGLFPNCVQSTTAKPEQHTLFLSRSTIREMVDDSGLLLSGEEVISERLIYSTSSQQTWLVVTTFQVFCLLDGTATRACNGVVQWAMHRTDATPIVVTPGRPGRIQINGRTGWKYSQHLHPNHERLQEALSLMIAATPAPLQVQPDLTDDQAFIFRDHEGHELARAHSLSEFISIVCETLDDVDFKRHYNRGHFMQWFRESIADPALAVDSMNRDIAINAPDTRAALVNLIRSRYQS